MSESPYLTCKEAAAHFRRSVKTIRRWIKEGRLRAYHIGRMKLIEKPQGMK